MIKATSSINGTPIKPHYTQAFGRNEIMTATADWLEDIQDGELTEGNFQGLNNVAEKMNDGPFKTFVKILAIGGSAFAATKVGSTKLINNLSNNHTVSKTFITPFTKLIHNNIEAAAKTLKSSSYFGEHKKGFKPLFVNNAAKIIDSIKIYGKRGSEELKESIAAEIKDLQAVSKDLNNVDKLSYTNKIKDCQERIKYAATENLVRKVTTTTAGAGAGTIAIVEANKDANHNGIADIAEHKIA